MWLVPHILYHSPPAMRSNLPFHNIGPAEPELSVVWSNWIRMLLLLEPILWWERNILLSYQPKPQFLLWKKHSGEEKNNSKKSQSLCLCCMWLGGEMFREITFKLKGYYCIYYLPFFCRKFGHINVSLKLLFFKRRSYKWGLKLFPFKKHWLITTGS